MNPAGEAQVLTEAVREFINAKLDNMNLKCLYLDVSTP